MSLWRNIAVALLLLVAAASASGDDLAARFKDPPPQASPWVYWYWMHGAVSREGITADLEAMKAAGIGGAYLFSIRDALNPPLIDPPIRQLTPQWWAMARHAMSEADRLGLQMGMHACDGFSVAGGPWITPELSMQRVVWSRIEIKGGQRLDATLPQPETRENFYRDIAVLAFPSLEGAGISTRTVVPKVTTSVLGVDPQSLATESNTRSLRSDGPCWIQYAFDQPFTCRAIAIRPDERSFQPLRLRIESSDDGQTFRFIEQLEPPRHGWQNGDTDTTFAIAPTTARFFRFVYDPAGSEPGAEDLDSAKWRPSLRVQRIELFSESRIHGFEGKSGRVWRISRRTTNRQVPDDLCVPLDRVTDLTQHMDSAGRLQWDVPEGNWTILRLGHTSTGQRNTPGGAGVGLECDKFNPEAARLQFDRWFGEAFRQIGPELASRVLKVFHVDSWEAGSQNWSPVFREEFKRRRGYDLLPWLPVMAGIPVGSAEASEQFLGDVRTTIAELVVDNFFGPMAKLAREKGCSFSAENVAPTMTSDAMQHFGKVDIPMGEFWLHSPTHDKPNDMLDAISAAHVYGKPIVQAESFTELNLAWDEHPALVKTLGDRAFALGINRLVFHVFVHNPWLDRRPGMTLGSTGLFFQRDQTWWGPAKAWVDYVRRCQVLLQTGRPVVDVAVFTGEELPRRAVLPERLVSSLPGIFGREVVERESKRLANQGQPQRQLPRGVTSSANISDPANWVDALHGYTYDSINPDALLRLATIRNGRIELPDGPSYGLLVSPEPRVLTPAMAKRFVELTEGGVPVIHGPYKDESFSMARDFVVTEADGRRAEHIAWTHRAAPDVDIYFVSNQQDQTQTIEVSLRVSGRVPELWDSMTGEIRPAGQWRIVGGRTILPLRLDAGGSIFVVQRESTTQTESRHGTNWIEPHVVRQVEGPWQVTFDPRNAGPESPVRFAQLQDWTKRDEPGVRYYSGTAIYRNTLIWSEASEGSRVWLDLGQVANIAEVALNGKPCGVAWTAPFRVEITGALRRGSNDLEIRVTNTWANRLIGDRSLPESQRVTWTFAPDRLAGDALLPAGLLGPVQIVVAK